MSSPCWRAAATRSAKSSRVPSSGWTAVCPPSGPPIAVITAYGSAENAVAALKAGAFDYLTKPVDLDQLRHLVRSAVRDATGSPAPEADSRSAESLPAR